jgi:hypothetical protein
MKRSLSYKLAASCGSLIIGVVIAQLLWTYIPTKLKVNGNTVYALMIGKANELKDANELDRASAVLLKATREHPDRYEAFYELALILEQSGKPMLAYSNYMSAFSLCGTGSTNLVPLSVQLTERRNIMDHISKLTNVILLPP